MNVFSEYLKKFLFVIVTVSVIITGAFFFLLNIQIEQEVQKLILESQAEVESIRNVVESNILQLVKDSEIFAGFISHHGDISSDYMKEMTQLFIDNIQLRKNYMKMRILDLSGKEVIRVDRVNDIPISKAEDELQDKSERYYFKDTANIDNDETYLSDLDLNVEKGEIEVPFKPTLRSGKKIVVDGNNLGYLILNYDIGNLIDHIHRKNNSIYKSKIIVNDRGDFIFSNKAEDNWSFVFDKKAKGMNEKYPEIWGQVNRHNKGYSEGDGWIVIYEKIDFRNLLLDNRIELSSISKSKGLYLIDYISDGHIKILRENIVKRNRKYLYLSLFIGFILSLGLASILTRLSIYKKTIKKNKKYDSLTALLNRDTGLKILNEKISKAKKKKSIISVSILKIRNIKLINRKYGYNFGDDIIKELGKIIFLTLEGDEGEAIRLSGNSFLIYMEDVDQVKTKINLDIICEKINEQDISDKSLLQLQYNLKIIDSTVEGEISDIIGEIEEGMKMD